MPLEPTESIKDLPGQVQFAEIAREAPLEDVRLVAVVKAHL